MGKFKEYEQYDGLGLAELVRQGQVTPRELCEEAIERIEQFNPELNAVVALMFDQGLMAAKGPLPGGPFRGVPFLLKDLLAAYAGVPLTGGCRGLSRYIPDHDSEMVTRFKKAGLVILGKTNTPEFGLLGYTEPDLFGPCRNPWNTAHTPGGSSGGSAAAVAAGITPLASGGDGGGSLRIPAACCGLFGLKPSRGRNPTGPDRGRIWQGAVQEHVLTRLVRDSAAMLDSTHGPDVGAPYEIRPPERPYLKEIENEPRDLKVAFTTKSPIGTPVHPECVKAVRDAARLLEDLGHRVMETEPDIDGLELIKSYLTLYFGEMAADIDQLESVLGRKAKRSDVETLTYTFGLLGRTFSCGHFVRAMRVWDMAARNMGIFFQKYNLYLTPALGAPPARIGELKPKRSELNLMKIVNRLGWGGLLKGLGIVDKMAQPSFAYFPFTQLANLTGLPAMSVPLHWTDGGLPCGVHFTAPFGDESTLFKLAAQLEKASPWFHRRPEMED